MSDSAEQSSDERDADRRVRKTRAALRSAFNALILTKGYDAFSAADVAERANVGRSTFYEHFQGKDDLLSQSLIAILIPLADACIAPAFDHGLSTIIDHFWQNRVLARALMAGRPRLLTSRQLAALIEARLAVGGRSAPADNSALPVALSAAQLAHGQLALIDEWLSGRHGVSAETIARNLFATSQAVAHAIAA